MWVFGYTAMITSIIVRNVCKMEIFHSSPTQGRKKNKKKQEHSKYGAPGSSDVINRAKKCMGS